MRPISLRRLVGGIGVFVALTTAVAVPVLVAAVSFLEQSEAVTFKARLTAARVAKYAFAHGPLWHFQRVRLEDLILLSEAKEDRIIQRVFKVDGKLVTQVGPALESPTFSRSAPIFVNGAIAGQMEVEQSLRPLLVETALAGAFSSLLGLLIYFGVRIFPIRVLDRTIGELAAANTQLTSRNREMKQREAELSLQNSCFDAALANMSQGLAMFDTDQRLVVCNERYAKLYDLAPELVKRGTTVRQIFEDIIKKGNFDGDLDLYLAELSAAVTAGKPSSRIRELPDGRSIALNYQPMRLGGFVVTHEDITERRRAEAKIAHMAGHDALTDLPNRVLLREQLEQALARVHRGESVAVLCLDLDRFKNVNDTLGHPMGDALLRGVSDRLQACVRPSDTVARLGGDEFAIIQVGAQQPSDATMLARRLIEAIGGLFDIDGHQVVIGTSIGIAVAPVDGDDPDQLLRNADMALYRAKSDGRGTYHFFHPQMDALMQARRVLELDLRKALAAGEFELYYQPLIDLASNEVDGFEALVRWNHPERGLVPPLDFIPLAEEIGLIIPIGDWVLRQACLEAMSWAPTLSIAVNLSPAQFKSRSLALSVVAALAASGLPARRLELEITETVLLQDSAATLEVLHQLRELGVRISMDDFGTGYSSLSYLRSFPFDKIKIDRSFVAELGQSNDCVAIVRAVTGLGSSLGMATTAEGVETEEQLDMLRAEGCTQVQGYLFSPPRPAAEIPRLLQSLALGAEVA
jgi:diguanylate cyclase (GGDEF)-like protein